MARKKPLLSAQNVEKRLRFANENVSNPPEYWDVVIFSDETKIIRFYHDGPQRVWRKPLIALEKKSYCKVWKAVHNGMGRYIQQGIWCNQCNQILNEIMTKEVYLDIKKFDFIYPVNPNKFDYKYYQDNDLKHKPYLCKLWSTNIKVLILIQSKFCGFI